MAETAQEYIARKKAEKAAQAPQAPQTAPVEPPPTPAPVGKTESAKAFIARKKAAQAAPVEPPAPPVAAAPKPPAPKPPPVAAAPKPPVAAAPKPPAPPVAAAPKPPPIAAAPAPAPKPPAAATAPTRVFGPPTAEQAKAASVQAREEAKKEAARLEERERGVAGLTSEPPLALQIATGPVGLIGGAAARAFQKSEFGQEQLRLMREGVGELMGMGQKVAVAAPSVLKGISADVTKRGLEKLASPAVMGAGSRVAVQAAAPMRTYLEEKAKEAQKEFEEKSRKLSLAEQAQKLEEQRAYKPPENANVEEARKLADAIEKGIKEEPTGKQARSPAQLYFDQRVRQLHVNWNTEMIEDPAEKKRLETLADQKALAELVYLYTQGGYKTFVPEDVLYGSGEKSVLGAFKPRLRVAPSGRVASAESIPGWVLNVGLSAPDFVATTMVQAAIEGQKPTVEMLINNVENRRDLLTYQLETDEELQADITSGDAKRIGYAVLRTAPTFAAMMATPDPISLTTAALEAPGAVAKAARFMGKADKILAAVKTAEKGARVGAFLQAAGEVSRAIAAEDAAKVAAKATEKAQKPLRTAMKSFLAEMEKPTPDRALAVQRMGEAVPEAGVSIRDRIAAYMYADPDVAEFMRVVTQDGKPLTPETLSALPANALDERLRMMPPDRVAAVEEAARRGQAKVQTAYEDALNRATDDFYKLFSDETVPQRTTRDVVPLPEVEEAEALDLFGLSKQELLDTTKDTAPLTPAQVRGVADAKTPEEMLAAVGRLPEPVRDTVARRFGLPNYAEMRRLAKLDAATLATKLAEAEQKIVDARKAATEAADLAAAKQALPGEIEKFKGLRKDFVQSERAVDAVEKKYKAFETAALQELGALGEKWRVAADEWATTPKKFKPSARVEAMLEKSRDYNEKMVALPEGPKKQAMYDKWAESYAKAKAQENIERAAFDTKKATLKGAAEEAKRNLVTRRQELATELAVLESERATAAQKLDAARAAFTGAYPEPRRSVTNLSPDEQAVYDFVGVPVYRRGVGDRVPMKWAAGSEAHFLDAALKRDAEAGRKYLSGATEPGREGVQSFAEGAARTPHVEAKLPFAGEEVSPKGYYQYQVLTPTPAAYTPSVKGPDGLPAQRGLPRRITWKSEGERLWKTLEQIAEKQKAKNLPRARTLEEYLRSLLPWSDPLAKAEDVDLVRVDDFVRVRDADVAKKVGPIEQPNLKEQRAVSGRIAPRVSDGVTARVVGFKQTPGGPVVVVQPHAWNGSSLVPAGAPVEVRPGTMLFLERGREGGVPHTPERWKQIRASEDALRAEGARTVRYASKDQFPEFAPPKRPTENEFNFNPDKMDRFFTPEQVQQIFDEMRAQAAPGATTQAPKAPKGAKPTEAEILAAQSRATAAADAVKEAEKARDAIRADIQAEQDLRTGIPREMPAYTEVAERARTIREAPPERVILPESRGVEYLTSDFADAARTLRRQQEGALPWLRMAWTRMTDFYNPAGELEFKSLKAATEELARGYTGRMRRVSEGLARAYAEIDTAVDALDAPMNARVAAVLDEFAPSFRGAVLSGAHRSDIVRVVTTAYFENTEKLGVEQSRALLDAVVAWAIDPTRSVESLREDIVNLSRGMPTAPLRRLQEGDVHFANGIATAGGWHETVVDANARGLTRTREDAEAANTFADALSGKPVAQGGRPRAALGRRVLADLLVPEDYRPTIKSFGLPSYGPTKEYAAPLVEAYGAQLSKKMQKQASAEVAKLRAQAVVDMDALLAQHEALLTNAPSYIPRAVREAYAKQVEKVVATTKTGGAKLLFPDYYRQAVVAGVLTSQPVQVYTDFYGVVASAFAEPKAGPRVAAKVFARSLVAQLLGTPGSAPLFRVVDAVRKLEPGSTARAYSALIGFTPEIHAIYTRAPGVEIFGMPASKISDICYEEGVLENMASGNLERTVSLLQQRMRERRFGVPFRWLEENATALADHANIAATRSRLAVVYTLMEHGMSARDAARLARQDIVGDFASELHPLEMDIINTLMPFWTFRKWNGRTNMRRLANPFLMTRFVKGEDYTSQVLSWMNDDSDEFGFHTESLDEEYDPKDMSTLRQEVLDANRKWSIQKVEEEALRLAAARGVPKARVRYDRMVARLREIAKLQGRKAALEAVDTDPDAREMMAYYAPDPVQLLIESPDSVLPQYHRDRYAVYKQEVRNQALQSWRRANIGRYAREDDEQRYMLFYADPFTTGLSEAALAVNIATVMARLAETAVNPDLPPGYVTEPTKDVLSGFLRSPTASLVMGATTELQPPEANADMTILSEWLGEKLFDVGLAKRTVQVEKGQTALDTEPRTGFKYVIPADLVNAVYFLGPTFTAPVVGTVQLANFVSEVTGNQRKVGPVDLTGQVMTGAGAVIGTRPFWASPKRQEFYAQQDIEERLKGLTEKMKSESSQQQDVPREVILRRGIAQHRQSPLAEEARRAAVLRAMTRGRTLDTDDAPFRAYLLDSGMPESRVLAMNLEELRVAVAETALAELASNPATQ